tara:strand:+ start:13755 stop:14939 length:1185 start_codon:yes stop_codon:yes gene_type:complete
MIVWGCWITLTVISFWLAYRRFYLSGIVFLCSTTLLVELAAGIYIWDLFFLFILFNSIVLSKLTLQRTNMIWAILFIAFLLLNGLLSGQYYSLIEISRLIQFTILVLILHSHYSKKPVEKVFLYILLLSISLNLVLHFLQIFRFDFSWSLKPTGAMSIGGFFNDSSEFGPIAILAAFMYYANFLDDKSYKFYGIPIFIACFAVVLSFNRTSFVLLPLLAVAIFLQSKWTARFSVLIFVILVIPFGISYSNKNFDLVYALMNDPSSLLGGTIELRMANWNMIFDHYLNYCNLLFGCSPGFFDVNRYMFDSGLGVFSVDNAFLRIAVSYGVLGCILFVMGSIFLFLKTRKYFILWPIMIGLGMMIELFKSLPVILVLICTFIFLLTNASQVTLERK